uniref:Venom protein family 13 protein 2a n=1 Tax=Pristhesancus plagipennis TaxID=1955184 RepID=A0A2K8JLP0_PRIPG|nr:venom protein family 13 protein 2a [Pristhesancus plagipennis]
MTVINRSGLLSVLLISVIALSNQAAETDKDVAAIKTQLTSMSTHVNHLIQTVNAEEISRFPILTLQTLDNQNTGTFKKPTDRKDLLNKLNELKNKITKLINDMTANTGDVTGIKERINMLEQELENLTKQLSNAGRDVKQELAGFANALSNLTASVNDYYKKQEEKEKARLAQKEKAELDEFLKAINYKLYDYAAFKLSLVNDDKKLKSFTLAAYKNVHLNIGIMLEFIKSVKEAHQKYLVYKNLYEYLKTYEKQPYKLSCEKHMKLGGQLHKDKSDGLFPGYIPELNDKSDAFNKFFNALDFDEFMEAIKGKNYEYAAFQLSWVNDDNKVLDLTIKAFKNEDSDINLKPFIDFVRSINEAHLRYIAYKALYTYIVGNNGKEESWKSPRIETMKDCILQDHTLAYFPEHMPELENKSDPFNQFFTSACNSLNKYMIDDIPKFLNDHIHIPFFRF